MTWDFEREHADIVIGCGPLICFTQLVVLSSTPYSDISDRRASSIRYFDWTQALWFCDLSDMFFAAIDANTPAQPR